MGNFIYEKLLPLRRSNPNLNMSVYNARLAKKMRSRVFRQMLSTRRKKYGSFLFYLKFFKYIAFAPVRGEFLESYYTLMRYLDDVADGDAKLPTHYSSAADYIRDRILFLDHLDRPKDDVDFMLLYCFRLADKFHEDFSNETRDIMQSLLFDAERRGHKEFLSKHDLDRHFHLMDIRGTIRATLKIFKDDPGKYMFLEPLGLACRHQYNLEDFSADIAAGYINIPLEESNRFGIMTEDLMNGSQGVKLWLKHHAAEGMSLLDEHHRKMNQCKFSGLQKAVFKVVYEMPAKRVFQKTLAT